MSEFPVHMIKPNLSTKSAAWRPHAQEAEFETLFCCSFLPQDQKITEELVSGLFRNHMQSRKPCREV